MNNPNAENTHDGPQDTTHPVLEMPALKRKKGPASPEAKQRVKYNALRHGFTGQVLIMTPEEREKFDAFVKGMMTDLAPVGTHETFLANSIAEEAWRLNQIRARCVNLSAVGDFDGAGDKYRPMEGQNPQVKDAVVDTVVARDLSKELALLSLYGQRTQRAYEKYKKELNELFVFSLQFIRAQAERHHRLILAKRTESDYRKRNNLTEITRAAGKAA